MVVRLLPKQEARVRFPYFAPKIMDLPKKFFHDRLVLLLVTVVAMLMVIGVSLVLLTFDAGKNPTTIVAYRPTIFASNLQSGKPIDIYSLAVFMIFISVASVVIGAKIYSVKRYLSVFMLAASIFLLILSIIVSHSLISIQ